jgi:nickel-type superoxide dismutase maturation protease
MSRNRIHAGQIAALLALLALFICIATDRLARPFMVSGRSMEPALEPGEIVLVDIWSYRHRLPRVGEVVLVMGGQSSGRMLVKRVALPPSGREASGEMVWLLGDNIGISDDSRRFGAVPAARIRGRVFWRYWPPGRMGAVRD